MSQNITLSPEEVKFAEMFLTKLDKKAANGKNNRLILLIILIIASIQGIYYLSSGWEGLESKTSILDELKRSEVPDGELSKLWLAGEVRRTSAILEASYRKHSYELLDVILGIIIIIISVFGFIFLRSHWDDYRRDTLLSKILWSKLQEYKTNK